MKQHLSSKNTVLLQAHFGEMDVKVIKVNEKNGGLELLVDSVSRQFMTRIELKNGKTKTLGVTGPLKNFRVDYQSGSKGETTHRYYSTQEEAETRVNGVGGVLHKI